MAEVGWDEVTYLTKRAPKSGEMRSQQVKFITICIYFGIIRFEIIAEFYTYLHLGCSGS